MANISIGAAAAAGAAAVAAAAAATAALCCYIAVVAAATDLLLPAAVRHCVPDGKICCWFIESDPSVFFLFIQTQFTLNAPLGSTVSLSRRRFAYILGNYGHARSQGGRQHAAAKPPSCIQSESSILSMIIMMFRSSLRKKNTLLRGYMVIRT